MAYFLHNQDFMAFPADDYEAFFEAILFAAFGKNVPILKYRPLGGGCINNAASLETKEGCFFLKWNDSQDETFFQAEAQGLELLADADTILVPQVVAYGKIDQKSYLLLENLNNTFRKDTFSKILGEQVALLHRQTHPKYGLHFDNFIGSLVQKNDFYDDWIDFFIEKRLRPQVGLAFYKGLIDKKWVEKAEKLYEKLPQLLPAEKSALLHGDLWSGNVVSNKDGEPALIDPAVYYGNREIEIAFTYLFGGFEKSFYQAYQATYPLLAGFEERKALYQLYPLLVHGNLFGKSYLNKAEEIIKSYL
jgi:fructosamine-3-kinase